MLGYREYIKDHKIIPPKSQTSSHTQQIDKKKKKNNHTDTVDVGHVYIDF